MRIETTVEGIRRAVREIRAEGAPIGLVPTMGALHAGHTSLLDIVTARNAAPVISIFVNPIQFNSSADFETYPRPLDADTALASRHGARAAFVPDAAELYRDRRTFIDMEYLPEKLCGEHRPGHFRGVYTIVAKLFNIIQPDFAVFGQKDIQQAITIEKMVQDLNFPLEIIIAPIVREPDGLAMSSRNVHLSPDERRRAVAIHAALTAAESLIAGGECETSRIERIVRDTLSSAGAPDAVDYVSLVDYETLHSTERITGKSVLAVAAWFGKTRLIDNMIIRENGACVY